MASSVVFINGKGDILIYRRFRDDVSRTETINFCNKIVAAKEMKENPINHIDGVSFIHTTSGDITLLATTKSNVNVALIMQFLYQVIILCKSYFKGEFDENAIRKNFVLIYELLDEIMDFGLPQITDPDLLKLYITQGKMTAAM
jgi:AP-2 complex subunit mu-1